MKCVRIVGQGIPHRLSDEDADIIVRIDKDGEYCSKQVWKDFHDNSADERFRVRRISKLTTQQVRRQA